jgi:hypothetical protein
MKGSRDLLRESQAPRECSVPSEKSTSSVLYSDAERWRLCQDREVGLRSRGGVRLLRTLYIMDPETASL